MGRNTHSEEAGLGAVNGAAEHLPQAHGDHPPDLEVEQTSGLKDLARLFLGGMGHPESLLGERSPM